MKQPKLLNKIKPKQGDIEEIGYNQAMSQLGKQILQKGGEVIKVTLSMRMLDVDPSYFTLEESFSLSKLATPETPYSLTLALLGQHLEAENSKLKGQLQEIRRLLELLPEDACHQCLNELIPFFHGIQRILSRSINENSGKEDCPDLPTSPYTQTSF